MTIQQMLQEIQEKIGNQDIIDTQKQKLYQVFRTRYNCSRVREARQYNTMSQEDFIISPLEEDEEIYDEVLNIFGGVSLSRVLSALGDEYPCSYQVDMGYIDILDEKLSKIPRKLLTEDGSDAMLSDQSPETIKAIWEIICK